MIKPHHLLAISLLFSSLSTAPILRADDMNPSADASSAPASKDLVDVTAPDSDKKFAADLHSGSQVTFTHSDSPAGVNVTVAPGTAGYPAAVLKPASGTWDLSPYGHIEVKVTNTGSSPAKLTIGIRVDDSGGWQDNDAENGYLAAGETQTIKVQFGMSFGKPGFAVNKALISQVMVMTTKVDGDAKTFRIESIKAVAAPK